MPLAASGLPRTMCSAVGGLRWWCHVTSRHVTSRHVTSRHVTSRHVTSRHVTSRLVTSRHVTSRHVMSCHMRCHVVSCHVMSCHVMSCHVMSCHVMSCHATSCDVRVRVHVGVGAGVGGGGGLFFEGGVPLRYICICQFCSFPRLNGFTLACAVQCGDGLVTSLSRFFLQHTIGHFFCAKKSAHDDRDTVRPKNVSELILPARQNRIRIM